MHSLHERVNNLIQAHIDAPERTRILELEQSLSEREQGYKELETKLRELLEGKTSANKTDRNKKKSGTARSISQSQTKNKQGQGRK